MSELPDPDTVAKWLAEGTIDATGETSGRADAERPLNLLVDPQTTDPLSELDRITEEGEAKYVGEDPAAAGLLAAAATVARRSDRVRLHYPEVDRTAEGPWLVLEPLGGTLATVSTGRAAVRVTIDRETGSNYGTLSADRDRIRAVLTAARPSHDQYPVENDADAVFTRGMTTFELDTIATADGQSTVHFEAATTPTTTADSIRDRFADEEGVAEVAVETVAGVERADPDEELRLAIERAVTETIGDYQYDWLSNGSALSRIPTSNKIAFGPGRPDGPFDAEAHRTATTVLERTVETWGDSG